ncbi:MAG TPA: sensor domain-containing diguanylate cyclase [Acidimicrobiales bacterium]|nr:sensor domain-containing diguanylate cyclase [Acidimicrobiales bacterium]
MKRAPVTSLDAAGPPVRGLAALASLARAVAAADDLMQTLEMAAEEARAALGASAVSIARADFDRDTLRVLVNVGVLAGDEVRFPTDEEYPFADFPAVETLLLKGEPYLSNADDPNEVRVIADWLRQCGRNSELGVPIMVDGEVWGELWAATAPGDAPLSVDDTEFLQAAALYVAAAVSHAEHLARLERLAFEDSLTGLANRRALDERLEAALERATITGRPVSLLVFDIDGMKEVNDRFGHDTGDEALISVADGLRRALDDVEGALAFRLGGDEFCILLAGYDGSEAAHVAQRALDSLQSSSSRRLTASCGVATTGPGVERPKELFRSADAAQYAAKRAGRGRVSISRPALDTHVEGVRAPWRLFRDRSDGMHGLLDSVLALLDGPLADADAEQRLEAIAAAASGALDVVSWTISVADGASDEVRAVLVGVAREDGSGDSESFVFDDAVSYVVADYPVTEKAMREESAFWVGVDDPGADAGEASILRKLRASQVLGAAARGRDGTYLLELYGDEQTAPLDPVRAEVRLLVLEAVHGAGRRVVS